MHTMFEQAPVSGLAFTCMNTVLEHITNSGKIALKRIRVRAINCLGGILFQVFLCPLFLLWGEIGKRACLEKLDQSCMYQFITRLASDIAADKLTVHTDVFA